MKPTIPDSAKKTIQSILSVFETGKTEPDYGAVTVLTDGAGISYGKHMSTDRAGSLDAIVATYIDRGGIYGSELAPYLPRLQRDETAGADPHRLPAWIDHLMRILTTAGQRDPIMRIVQDEVFDTKYWIPAAEQAAEMGLVYPLSWCICYDTTIHSGPSGIWNIRKRFAESPPASGGDEKAWARAYLRARRQWLADFNNARVRRTVVRIDALWAITDANNWDLETPLIIGPPYRVTIGT